MDKLHVLWTTDKKEVFLNMIAPYVLNSKKREWWKDVNLIVWGSSVRLLSEDVQVQTEVFEMISSGVTVEACESCCDTYAIKERLRRMGIKVRMLGKPFTEYIKSDDKVITL